MPSRARRLRNLALDLILPFGGPSYERKRAERAPNGWVVASARVASVERDSKVVLRVEQKSRSHDVCGTVVRYIVDETGVELVDDLDLSSDDVPAVGETTRLAYNPNDPRKFVLLTSR